MSSQTDTETKIERIVKTNRTTGFTKNELEAMEEYRNEHLVLVIVVNKSAAPFTRYRSARFFVDFFITVNELKKEVEGKFPGKCDVVIDNKQHFGPNTQIRYVAENNMINITLAARSIIQVESSSSDYSISEESDESYSLDTSSGEEIESDSSDEDDPPAKKRVTRTPVPATKRPATVFVSKNPIKRGRGRRTTPGQRAMIESFKSTPLI